jgi:hypothetical protein
MPESELDKVGEKDVANSDDESVGNENPDSQNDAEQEIVTENTESVERKKGNEASSCSSVSFRQTQKTRRTLDSGEFYPSDNEDSGSEDINQHIGRLSQVIYLVHFIYIAYKLPFHRNKFRF